MFGFTISFSLSLSLFLSLKYVVRKKKFKKQLQFIIDQLRNKEVDQNPSAKYYKNIQKRIQKRLSETYQKVSRTFQGSKIIKSFNILA